MAPKSCGEEVAGGAGGRMIIDVGSDIKVPLPMFSGLGEIRGIRNIGWFVDSA